MLKWFSNKSNLDLPLLDFSVLGTDIHSHLIPAIDDGSPDIKTSISIIKKLKQLGYKKIITTPHVMSDCYRNSSETILAGLSIIRNELKLQNINIEIDAAAEYYIDYEFESKIESQDFLTFGDNYLLVELSFVSPPRSLFDTIFKLQIQGYQVVLAHPERYQYFGMKDYEDLVSRGVFLQINLLSLLDYYSAYVKEKTKELISQKMVSFIGTDCHHIKHAGLYEKCQKLKSWHDLYASGKLLNSSL